MGEVWCSVSWKLRIGTFGLGRVGKVKPGLLVTSKRPSVTGLATFARKQSVLPMLLYP